MLESIVMAVFVLGLVVTLLLNIPVIYALICGYFIFFGYALKKGKNMKQVFQMSIEGIKSVKNILLVFMLIGIVTAMWRASGTISIIIYYGVGIIRPSIFILASFLLCALLSTLIGTSFGTCATMGVICITIARTMGINEIQVAGAIVSGIYFGDRCSPMSTSALLVSTVTNTNLYDNILKMIKTSAIPTVLTCLFYYYLGMSNNKSIDLSTVKLFSENYNLNVWLLIPAAVIIVFSILRFNVKISLSVSILTAFILAIIFQKERALDLMDYAVFGYSNSNETLNEMMKGGGMLSMVKVAFIVGISSSYSGIFKETGLLNGLSLLIKNITKRTTEYCGVMVTSILTSAVACNQTLSTILTEQICRDLVDREKLAIYIENSVIVIAALLPWNIALKVPMDTLGVGKEVVIYSAYAYILPIYTLIISFISKSKAPKEEKINL